jgi:hypothetical protein
MERSSGADGRSSSVLGLRGADSVRDVLQPVLWTRSSSDHDLRGEVRFELRPADSDEPTTMTPSRHFPEGLHSSTFQPKLNCFCQQLHPAYPT